MRFFSRGNESFIEYIPLYFSSAALLPFAKEPCRFHGSSFRSLDEMLSCKEMCGNVGEKKRLSFETF